MKARWWPAMLCLLLLLPTTAGAQNAVLNVSQDTLNRLVGRLGSLADEGMFQPMMLVEDPTLPIEICDVIGFMDCPGLPRDLGFREPGLPLVVCWERGGTPRVHIVPAGPPIPWQWWVSGAGYTLASGSMTFTATVHSRVGDVDKPPVTRTVPASVSLDTSTDPVRLRFQIGAFTVPIESGWTGIFGQPRNATQVDVAKLYSISIPLEKQALIVPRPEGGSQTLNGRAVGMTVQYLFGRLRLNFDLGF